MISHQARARISKSIFALTFLTLFYTATFGQSVKLTTGKLLQSGDFKENGLRYADFVSDRNTNSVSSAFFTPDNEAHIGFGVERKDTYYYMVLQNYLNVTDIRKVSAEGEDETSAELKHLAKIGGRNFLFYTQRSEASKETTVYVNEMSNKDVLLGTPLKLLTISEENSKLYGEVGVITSENKKSILVYQFSTPSDYVLVKPTPKISCLVLDENFGKVWQGDLDWSASGRGDLRNVKIDDEGNVYALLYFGKEKKQKAAVFCHAWQKERSFETVLGNNSADAKTYGCQLSIIEGKDPVVAGLSLLNDELFYFATLIDPGTTGKNLMMKAFSETDRSWMSKAGENFFENDMKVQHIVKTGNADYVFSIEVSAIVSSSGINRTNYYSGRIYVVSTGLKGENWNKLINKRQIVSYNPFLSGHALINQGNDTFVFYNDVGTNFRSEKMENSRKSIYEGGSTVLVMQKINAAGEMTNQPIPTGQTGDFGINPKYFIKIRDGLYHTQLSATMFTKIACIYSIIELK